jgi:hypothetical protein
VTRGRHEAAIGLLAGLAAAVLASCSSSNGEAPKVRASGPARVRIEVVARHAGELDEGELASRPAGSQQEGAAAAYVLGHLQQAGYGARLEGVPVANTVSSTDVLALPPAGGAPDIVVAVPYDTGAGPDRAGARVGLFLELARALAVADPGHRVGFAALGAEATKVGGGHLGSRRLVRLLEGEGEGASIVTIEAIELEGAANFGAFGLEVSPVTDVAERLGVPVAPLPPPEPVVGRELTERARVFTEAGLDHVAIAGGAAEVGRVLLEYLAAGERSPASGGGP